ncbi:hypothetical protein MuYL_3033 [Mucilaginibacter xinganensis]|uniref:2'-5' RNA ligase n=2 Tax=Mucilaginibacter xinganensis TaxID=1234841 RepID=A0A223NZA7_9SPHI|nr:hypothetical protein MuYL_3033 [Mucilaginibacter xinganensis]
MIICLPSELVKEISRYKQASVNAIGHFEAMHTPAYITITHQVRCKPFLAQPAIARMEQRISSLPPAELYLNGFGYFSHGSAAKTIYAQIEPTQRNENWFKLLAMQMGIKLKDFTPNVTIVKNIPATTFNKLWPNFHNRKFKYPFTVNSLTILHKDTFTEHDEWRVYRELSFGNKLSAF